MYATRLLYLYSLQVTLYSSVGDYPGFRATDDATADQQPDKIESLVVLMTSSESQNQININMLSLVGTPTKLCQRMTQLTLYVRTYVLTHTHTHLAGSRQRFNQLQQFAIRLNMSVPAADTNRVSSPSPTARPSRLATHRSLQQISSSPLGVLAAYTHLGLLITGLCGGFRR